ncbi:MAG UNVERIFIED_CONTAM: hypothetical protein LVQ98_02015 [Rickettsiaceae bacterium]|jgi:hypothetical protein
MVAHKPFLLSNIYGYKVDKENFVEINNLMLQGLGKNDSKSADPHIVPEVNFRYIAPIANLNDSKLKIDNYTAVYQNDQAGKVSRSIWALSLYNSHITDSGFVLAGELYNRADLYNVNSDDKQFTMTRNIPEIRASLKYPLISQISNSSLIIEPVILGAAGMKKDTFL